MNRFSKVIITEKPSVAIDIAKAFGSFRREDGYISVRDYAITWAYGHLASFDESEIPRRWRVEDLPIIPKEFNFKIDEDKESHFLVIQNLLDMADEAVIATDAGREGEMIARTILKLSNFRGKTYRFWTSEALSPEVVNSVFANLKNAKEFDSLYYSALARHHSDWIMGINLTRLVTLKANDRSSWSVGRVQTPILKQIVDKEKEIQAFKATSYFRVYVEFNQNGNIYDSILTELGKEEADKIASSLKEAEIISVEKETKGSNPPNLHSLTSLQREANSLYDYSADETLKIAQKLYENKFISYPRTDAEFLDESDSTKELVKKILINLNKEELIKNISYAEIFDNSKLTDHYAIIPQKEAGSLNEEELNIYNLVKRRFLANFMNPHSYENVKIVTKAGEFTFDSTIKNDIDLGWKVLFDDEFVTNEANFEVGKVEIENILKDESKTKAPARYSENTILGMMEKYSLGTPATRAGILETLKRREYMIVDKKALKPTQKAMELIEKIGDREFANSEMTQDWEDKLNDIYINKLGSEGYENFVDEMKSFVAKNVNDLKSIRFQKIDSVGSCGCGGFVVEYGRSYRCVNCNAVVYKEVAGKKITLNQALELFSGKFLFLKGFKNRAGESFSANIKIKDGKSKLLFSEDSSEIAFTTCHCGGDIIEMSLSYNCVKCRDRIFKEFHNKNITQTQAKKLFAGEKVKIKDLEIDGENFEANLEYKDRRLSFTKLN